MNKPGLLGRLLLSAVLMCVFTVAGHSQEDPAPAADGQEKSLIDSGMDILKQKGTELAKEKIDELAGEKSEAVKKELNRHAGTITTMAKEKLEKALAEMEEKKKKAESLELTIKKLETIVKKLEDDGKIEQAKKLREKIDQARVKLAQKKSIIESLIEKYTSQLSGESDEGIVDGFLNIFRGSEDEK